jgi:hypothetical protein
LNPDDALPDEMERLIRHDDGGPLGTDAAESGDLALFAEEFRAAFPETSLPDRVAQDHMAAMIGAIQLLAEKGESALEPTSNAHGPERRVPGLPKLRRRTMKRKLVLSLAVTAGMLVSLAGLAHAGVLPGPVQGVADQILGIDEGDQGNLDDGAVNDADDGAVGDVDDGAVGDVDDGAVGDVDDGAVGDLDEGDQGNLDNGAVGNVDDGAVGDANEGDQGNVDNGAVGDTNEGDQGNVDNGAVGDSDDSAVGDADGGAQGDADGGSQGNIDNGSQGDGDNGSNG